MNRVILVSCLLSIAAVFVLHAVYLGVVAEDAFISFRFAKNLASGKGLVWNVGEPPVEGYTNFLWILLCAAGLFAHLDAALFAQYLGVAASLATLAYAFLFCRRLLGLGPYMSLIPCAFLACAGPFATWATSGMETNLFTLLLVSACYYEVSYWNQRRKISLSLAFLLSLLATLTRPEGFAIFLIILGMHFVRAVIQKDSKEVKRCFLLAAIFYLLPFSLYFTWRFSYYGYLLPNTFYAKTGGTIYQWYRGVKYVCYFAFHFIAPLLPLLSLSAWHAADVIPVTRNASMSATSLKRALQLYGLAICLVICLCYVSSIIFVGGDYMAMYRFFVPILPFIYIVVAYGFHIILADPNISSTKRLVAASFLLIGLMGTVVHSTPVEERLFSKPSFIHGQHRGVIIERLHSKRLSLIGRFFNQYKKNENESLATGAIGAISYFSDLRIYGFHGLVDPFIAHTKGKALGRGFPGHEKTNILHILSKKPTYFMFNRALTEEPLGYPNYPPEVMTVLERDYELVSQWIEDIETGESGYFTFLQRKTSEKR